MEVGNLDSGLLFQVLLFTPFHGPRPMAMAHTNFELNCTEILPLFTALDHFEFEFEKMENSKIVNF